MCTQIEIGAVSNPHQFIPLPFLLLAFREKAILNINGSLGVVSQLLFRLLIESQIFRRDSDAREPLKAFVNPLLVRLLIFAGTDEVFHLHLFKFARAKDEVAWRDFVAKRFAHLRHTERKSAAAGS